ncbi:hypothetical protein JCM14469_30520 [Desulfatiferula olefinivorans]
MNSTLIKAKVFHQRFFPARHGFSYPLSLYCLDLSELTALDRGVTGFGYNRMGIASLYDRDYLDGSVTPLYDRIRARLVHCNAPSTIDRIMLVTSLRRFSAVFNPVSFYLCLDKHRDLIFALAEVNNTFGERHLYPLKPEKKGSAHEASAEKVFHVSPFNTVSGTYDFRFGPLDKGLAVRIVLSVDGRKKFVASLTGDMIPLTGKNLAMMWLRHPFTPHLTMGRILKEAAVLFFQKKLPYIPKPVSVHPNTVHKEPSNLLQKIARTLFIRGLSRIRRGFISVTFPDGSQRVFGDSHSPHRGELRILDDDFFPQAVFRGDIGFGEAYMDGLFETPDPAALVGALVLAFSGGRISGRVSAFLRGTLERVISRVPANSLRESPRNIKAHYDISNPFYRLFLDEYMVYSSGIFDSDEDSLEEAQLRKIRNIIAKADIRESDHVLEIGSGWGAFAFTAVRDTGCRVTTLTLSNEQHEWVSQKVKELGLENRIEVLLKDYRTMTGRFDKIVSIEMLEAVGHRYLGTFFSRCDALLKPGGRVVVQVITLPDQEYAAYRMRVDWIQKHIFPGGHLPSLTALCRAMTRRSSLIVDHLENIGPHYAVTLKHWHRRFTENRDRIAALGFDDRFMRKWEYYLTSCEAVFRVRGLENLQLVLRRPYE